MDKVFVVIGALVWRRMMDFIRFINWLVRKIYECG